VTALTRPSLGTNSRFAQGFFVGLGVGCGGCVRPGGWVEFGCPLEPGEGDGESLGFGANPQIRQLKRP
jgi:hypothetical protein